MEQDFLGRKVLVSGGTAGIGFAAAKHFARRGATVTVTGRSAERGKSALEDLGDRGFFQQGDSGDADEAATVVSAAAEVMDGIDVVVSAGAENHATLTTFAEMTPAQIRGTFDSLIYPRLFPLHAAVPYLRDSGGGSMVLIGSDAARHATRGESLVGAAGAAVILMTKALARELARDRIRVNSIALTITSGTPGWEHAFGHEFGRKLFARAIERFPFGRPPEAEEVADAIVFLASAVASQISGQTVSVNGGLSFGGW
ncbi:SDR family oxidoreductase [Amycolatopsis acidicola]|uniref:SDR family oxidoreductase n=1 Tax=Amycolatopsis acidicola TaxID=2596893 RepID=A0A5N0VD85_9PSEU|nr:SDR family oxidoreductase [Amycolatopsis acidicola]KAA9163323.1 SDR family oxidoreductase [Amycolatopsis acidicola]